MWPRQVGYRNLRVSVFLVAVFQIVELTWMQWTPVVLLHCMTLCSGVTETLWRNWCRVVPTHSSSPWKGILLSAACHWYSREMLFISALVFITEHFYFFLYQKEIWWEDSFGPRGTETWIARVGKDIHFIFAVGERTPRYWRLVSPVAAWHYCNDRWRLWWRGACPECVGEYAILQCLKIIMINLMCVVADVDEGGTYITLSFPPGCVTSFLIAMFSRSKVFFT